MFRSALIALAATSAIAIASAPAHAKKKVDIDFGLFIGGGGVVIAPGVGVYDDYYYVADEEYCGWQTVKHKKWNKAHTKKIVYFTKEWVCG